MGRDKIIAHVEERPILEHRFLNAITGSTSTIGGSLYRFHNGFLSNPMRY